MIFTACRIGFLQEIPRSWDYWLKGVDMGVMDEPMLRGSLRAWEGDTELRHRNWDRNIYRKFF
jgi:hypothetical protein